MFIAAPGLAWVLLSCPGSWKMRAHYSPLLFSLEPLQTVPRNRLTLRASLMPKPPASHFLTWQGNLDVAKRLPRFLSFTQLLAMNPCHHKQDSERGRPVCHVSFRGDCGTAAVKKCFCFHILWPRRGPHREWEGGVWKGGSHWLDLRALENLN